jgi:hypothetical protein
MWDSMSVDAIKKHTNTSQVWQNIKHNLLLWIWHGILSVQITVGWTSTTPPDVLISIILNLWRVGVLQLYC